VTRQSFCTTESERESLLWRAGHTDEEIQAGADGDIAAANRSGNRERKGKHDRQNPI